MATYRVYGGNQSGATTSVDDGVQFRSVRQAVAAARKYFASGWTVTVYEVETGMIVKKWTIRK